MSHLRGDELVEAICSPETKAEVAESATLDLLDEVFAGYPVVRLRRLLGSNVATAVRAGVWIASELGERAAPLSDEIIELLQHGARYVRFFAIDTIISSSSDLNVYATAKAIALVEDPDDAVRWKVLQLLTRISSLRLANSIRHVESQRLGKLVQWLHGQPVASEVLPRLEEEDRTVRLIAVVAAARMARADQSPLMHAATIADVEVSSFAKEQLETTKMAGS